MGSDLLCGKGALADVFSVIGIFEVGFTHKAISLLHGSIQCLCGGSDTENTTAGSDDLAIFFSCSAMEYHSAGVGGFFQTGDFIAGFIFAGISACRDNN